MVLNIVKLGEDDVLRKKSHPVAKIDRRLKALLKDMAETMYAADGVGLAAPQVGILRRVVVIDVGEGLVELINPEIVSQEGEVVAAEGCLSVPGRRGTVKRPEKVTVRALDKKGNAVEYQAEGLFARAICHELDHLDGIVYVDKMIEDVTEQTEQEEG
ncbi:MAG: peptide deformylase [Clostridia bacterium]|nr:peptide deformylase [Clostridia bacterium]